MAGKIWYGMGYGGLVPYHGMVWYATVRFHTNTTPKDMGYYAVPVANEIGLVCHLVSAQYYIFWLGPRWNSPTLIRYSSIASQKLPAVTNRVSSSYHTQGREVRDPRSEVQPGM